MGTKACIAVLLVSILSLAAPGATIQQKTWADMDAWNADMLSGWLAIGVPYMRIWVWSFGEQTYNGKDVDGVWLDAAEMSVRFSKAGGTAGIIYHDRSFPTLRPNLDSTSTDSIRIDFSTPLAGYAMVIDSAQQVEIRLIDPNGDILQDWQVQPSTDVFWGFQCRKVSLNRWAAQPTLYPRARAMHTNCL